MGKIVFLNRTKLAYIAAAFLLLGATLGLIVWQVEPWVFQRIFTNLRNIKDDLRTDLRTYFHVRMLERAKNVIANKEFQALLTDLVNKKDTQDQLTKFINEHQPPTWRDFAFISNDGALLFSCGKILPPTVATIPAVQDILSRVPVLLKPLVGEFGLLPDTQTPVLPVGFPVISGNQYLGTAIVALDYQQFAEKFESYKRRLNKAGEIIIAKEKDGNVYVVLFSSNDRNASFRKTYWLQDRAPIAKACRGEFGESLVRYEQRWIASSRDHSPHAHWSLVVQEDHDTLYRTFRVLRAISLILLAIGFLLSLVLLTLSLDTVQRLISPLLLAFIALGLFLSIFGFHYYFSSYKKEKLATYQANVSQEKINTQYIASLLLQHSFKIQTTVHTMVLDLHKNKVSPQGWVTQAQKAMSSEDSILQINNLGLSYIATSSQKNSHPWNTFFVAANATEIGRIYDSSFTSLLSTSTSSRWISNVQQKELGNSVYNIYCEPFFNSSGTLEGYVWATISWDQLLYVIKLFGHDRLTDIGIYDSELISIYLFDIQWVRNKSHALDIQEYYGTQAVRPVIKEAATKGKSGSFKFNNTVNVPWIMLYESLPDMKWILAVFTCDYSLDKQTTNSHRYASAALIFLIFTLVLALALMTKIYNITLKSLSWFSPFYAALLACGTIGLIVSNYWYTNRILEARAITSELQALQWRETLQQTMGIPYIPIKTHVNVEFLNIENPQKVKFSITVEQRIDRKRYPNVKEGVEIANKADQVFTREINRRREGDTEIIQYQIQGIIHQVDQTYTQVPFDIEPIGIWLSPTDRNSPILLEPDLERYPVVDPKTKPGVGTLFQLKDYNIVKSYYAFKWADNKPLLKFAMLMQRNYLDVFLEYFLPLLVILISIFLLTIVSGRVTQLKQVNIITAITGLFFALILLHQRYRSSLVIAGFSYMEAFIMGVYLSLAYAYFDALYLIARPQFLPAKKLFYWSLLMTYMFIITIIAFGP